MSFGSIRGRVKDLPPSTSPGSDPSTSCRRRGLSSISSRPPARRTARGAWACRRTESDLVDDACQPQKVSGSRDRTARVAYEVTWEVVLGRVHPDNSCPEDPGDESLALKGQPWHRPFRDRQSAFCVPPAHIVVISVPESTTKSTVSHRALIGLELQSQLGAHNNIAGGSQRPVSQRDLDSGHLHRPDR